MNDTTSALCQDTLSVVKTLVDLYDQSQHLAEKDFLTYGLDILCSFTRSEIAYLHFINADQETIELVTWSTGTHTLCTAAFDNHYPISRASIWADSFRYRKPVIHNDYVNAALRQRIVEDSTSPPYSDTYSRTLSPYRIVTQCQR